MPVTAYILTTVKPGTVNQVLDRIRDLPGVDSAHLVTGPYDIIALIRADDLEALRQLLIDRVLQLEDIEKTLSSIVLD